MKPPPEDLLWHHCRAGHTRHAHKTVRHNLGGRITIYDWPQYTIGSDVYCPGQDVISESIDESGMWEPEETAVFLDLLDGAPGLVLDLGCHIGWYSHLARQAAHPVWMVDASAENLELARHNATGAKSTLGVIDQDVEPFNEPVKIVKIDIEGSERYAVQMLRRPIRRHEVAALLMEISPVFNDSYAGVMRFMDSAGYDCWQFPPGCGGLNEATSAEPLAWRDWLGTVDQADVLYLPRQGTS